MNIRFACLIVVLSVFSVAAFAEETDAGVRIPPKPAASDGQIVVFEDRVTGPVRIMNAVNGAPAEMGTENFAAWRAAEIPFARTHDLSHVTSYGGNHAVDITCIFTNFEADVESPASYDFANTDVIVERIQKAGTKVFYRLGQSIESPFVHKYGVVPPRDFGKWARIAEHIIAHYTEGWADGFRYDIAYWEIWNEPDLGTATPDECRFSPTWTGTRDQFKEFWKTAQRHLKARFPHLKIGGPALTGATAATWGLDVMREFAAEKIPVDFYSWHGYAADPSKWMQGARTIRKTLDELGYVNCESIYNEWNYMKDWGRNHAYSMEVESGRYNQKGAAFTAAMMNVAHREPIDMLMYYDARLRGMNGMFDPVTQLPMRGYYAFYAWSRLRRLGTCVASTSDLADITVTAARGAGGRLGAFIVRYDEDNNVTHPVRVTIRRASGKSLDGVTCHVTDDVRLYTETPVEANADGSVDLVLRPCSFAYLEL